MNTDLSYLESMTEGDTVLISEMIEIFSTQVVEFGKQMQELLERKNWQELSKLAHKAKSSVAIMGMTALSEKLRDLEKLSKEEKEVHSYPEYIDFFNTASRDAVAELNNYLTTR
jgi:HPt (histidine-containing phosphotransfer) domain-containing protein